jgi:hypothetical protein
VGKRRTDIREAIAGPALFSNLMSDSMHAISAAGGGPCLTSSNSMKMQLVNSWGSRFEIRMPSSTLERNFRHLATDLHSLTKVPSGAELRSESSALAAAGAGGGRSTHGLMRSS